VPVADLVLLERLARRRARAWPNLRVLGVRLKGARIHQRLKTAFVCERAKLSLVEVLEVEAGTCRKWDTFIGYLDALELDDLNRGLFVLAGEVAFDRAGVPR
jgi:hypothetical protein